jgi:Protein of unknown function (DUF3237)
MVGWRRARIRVPANYTCLRPGPPGVIDKLDKGEPVDPTSYYFRMNPIFETSSTRYDWINRLIAVGTGIRLPDGSRLQYL